ncbi:MAG TPA: phosphatase PAP2 family protein [Candidatus Limnocylindrales bacterium]|nr:phosphatase PAP2 family protein [Candidatus Limnocylindrales bacterium]
MTPACRTACRGALLAWIVAACAFPADAGAEGIGSTVAGDLRSLWSVRSLEIVGAGAALTLAVRPYDDPDAAVRRLGRGAVEGFGDVGNFYGGYLVFAAAAGAWGAGNLAHDPGLIRAGSELTRSLVYTSVVVTGLKVAFHRTRPNGGRYSFPSGHAAVAFAVAPVLARRFGRLAEISSYALAAGTAMGRMEDRKHYLSDVVFGAAVGASIGIAVARDHGEAAAPHASLSFVVRPDAVGLAARF